MNKIIVKEGGNIRESLEDFYTKPEVDERIPTKLSDLGNDVGFLTEHQDISDKVDKEAGKGLSTNDYSNADKTIVSKIITDGLGDKYLSDDGSYKEVSGGGGGVSEVEVKDWISRNIAVNAAYSLGNPSATGSYAIASGYSSSATGGQSVALGRGARAQGANSIAIGYSSNVIVMTGEGGVSIGASSWSNAESVALGTKSNTGGFKNCTSLGYQATTTATNQVQLGDSATTTYAYGAVQDRSDARDKTDIRDIELGLDFINKLRPVEYKWDYREDYFRDIAPQRDDFEDEESYIQALEQARADFFKNPVKDGSKTRVRYHTGLIAQEVKQVMDDLDVDFGGFQHHQMKGGLDVMSLGYSELIPVLVKAVQTLTQKVEDLEGKLEEK